MYKRIIILGGIGSGKSTLANRISLFTGFPAYHLDNILYNSKWERIDKSKWKEISKQFLSKDTGIVDGNYTTSLPNRIKWADLIIFVDASTLLQLRRYFRRIIWVRLGIEKRHGIPEGAKTKFRFKIFNWILDYNRREKKKIFSMLESAKDKKIVIIKKPRELDIKSLLE